MTLSETLVTAPKLETSTSLAFERTWLAWERTQMAWIRTAVSLISFGFTIAKFFEFLSDKQGTAGPIFGAQTVGTVMIVMGLVALAISTVQHKRAELILRAQCPQLPKSLAWVTALMLALIGVLALIGAVIRT